MTAQFSAVDPEGDLLTYHILNKPARGAVTMPEDGSSEFVYTPYENKTGKDSFTYVAVDAVGNSSDPATVKIKIEKPNTKVTYADMDGDPAHKAAIRLAEEGIFVGECMGGAYFFQPDAAVTRGEFVAMAMNAAGMEALEDVERTGFADDVSIPTWAKPYVSAAQKAGMIQGSGESRAVFAPSRTITQSEAAVLLDRLLRRGWPGDRLLLLYLVLYAPLRFVLEWFRGDVVRGFLGVLSTSQWVALITVAAALPLLVRRTRRRT